MPVEEILLAITSIHWGGDYMNLQWCAGLMFLAIYYSFYVYSKTDFIPAITLCYLLLNCIFTFACFLCRWHASPPWLIALSGNLINITNAHLFFGAAFSCISMILLSFFFMEGQESRVRYIDKSLAYFAIANSLYVILGFILQNGVLSQGVGYSGFLNYAGMNSCLIAMLSPYVFDYDWTSKRNRAIAIGLCIIAIVLSKSSIPYGVFVCAMGGYALHKKRAFNPLLLLAIIPLVLGFAIERMDLFSDGYRFKAYQLFTNAWWVDMPKFIGAGGGTFQSLGTLIQIKNNFMVDYSGKGQSFFWLWEHSDYLQTLFEYGIIGFLLIIILSLNVIIRLYQRESSTHFGLALGLTSSAFLDFPVRYFSMAFLTMYVIALAYKEHYNYPLDLSKKGHLNETL